MPEAKAQPQTKEEPSISKYAKEQLKLVKGKRGYRKAKPKGRKETRRPKISVENVLTIIKEKAHYSTKPNKAIADEFGCSVSSVAVIMRQLKEQGILPKNVNDIVSNALQQV